MKSKLSGFPYYKQLDAMDCGPSALRMVAKYYGKSFSLAFLREKCYIDKEGVSLKGISEAAESIGFRTLAVQIPYGNSDKVPCLLSAPLPCIVHWNQNHFLVVFKINKKFVWIADPASGKYKLNRKEFEQHWLSRGVLGIALLLAPSPVFYEQEGVNTSKKGFSFLWPYVTPYRKLAFQVLMGMGLGSLFLLIFPFLTQAIVDVGIENQNLGFIYIILIAQLTLFLSQTGVQVLQSWILLHISVRINVNLIADFLIKLMNLPLGFFDAKMTGDLLQRIRDHYRVEQFLTRSTLTVLFSMVNLVVFAIVLFMYNLQIFSVFVAGAVLYLVWIFFFLKKRKEVDYMAFQQHSDNQNALIEIIQGMPDIKLSGSQQKRRWAWTNIQAKLFNAQMKSLTITQYQDADASFISQLKDILISFIAAKSVIEGQMTLGMMLAVQYMIGQLNVPLNQLVGFIRAAQDAKISLERLGEIHEKKNEETQDDIKIQHVPDQDIIINGLSFKYTPISNNVLDNITISIPYGKITAIVGTSGSGKTTLLKLLLGFYQPTKGNIKIGATPLDRIHQKVWRSKCGVVMQEGYIFSNSIADNIAESDERMDTNKLEKAMKVANITDFIESLPLQNQTMIGAKGNGISQGQKQRLLLARAVYKDPEFILLDEATNALDAKNEKVIMENLNEFFKGKTVVIVAHRLSTVKLADQIIVLENGKVMEVGKHEDLVHKRGAYFDLVSNQLELAV